MKPRARRIALLTVAAGCLVVVGMVAANWNLFRDSLEGWHFIATRKTHTMMPDPALKGQARGIGAYPQDGRITVDHGELLRRLADYSGTRVVLDAQATTGTVSLPVENCLSLTGEVTLQILRAIGYRILELRFPDPAYVIADCPPRERMFWFRLDKSSNQSTPMVKAQPP